MSELPDSFWSKVSGQGYEPQHAPSHQAAASIGETAGEPLYMVRFRRLLTTAQTVAALALEGETPHEVIVRKIDYGDTRDHMVIKGMGWQILRETMSLSKTRERGILLGRNGNLNAYSGDVEPDRLKHTRLVFPDKFEELADDRFALATQLKGLEPAYGMSAAAPQDGIDQVETALAAFFAAKQLRAA